MHQFYWKLTYEHSGLDFTNMFTFSLYTSRSWKSKTTDELTIIFVLLGSMCVKAACKTLVKSTPIHYFPIQVLTTVKTAALPVTQLEFPAVTICSKGNNEEVLGGGFFKLFLKFLKDNGINLGISPYKAANLVRNSKLQVPWFLFKGKSSYTTYWLKDFYWNPGLVVSKLYS